jgi:hypothetical protein
MATVVFLVVVNAVEHILLTVDMVLRVRFPFPIPIPFHIHRFNAVQFNKTCTSIYSEQ